MTLLWEVLIVGVLVVGGLAAGVALVGIGWRALRAGTAGILPRRPAPVRRKREEPWCRHDVAPEPVYVSNKAIGGNPELVRWLCPLCLDAVPGPIDPQPPCDHHNTGRERVTSYDGSYSREFCTGCGSEVPADVRVP